MSQATSLHRGFPRTAALVLLLCAIPATLAVALLAATGALSPPVEVELADPGALTHWGLPISQALRDIAAAATIGALVTAAALLPGRPEAPRMLGPGQLRLLTVAATAGSVWVWAGVANLVLVSSDLAGQPPFASPLYELIFFATDVDLGRALFYNLLLGGVVAFGALLVRTVTGTGLLALIALGALWPLALTGHAASRTGHDLGVNLQFVHLAAGAVWLGGLLALLLVRTTTGPQFPTVVRRYSRLAGWCFLGIAVSGVLAAWVRVPSWAELRGDYGLLLLLKITALAALGVAGWVHRSRLLGRLDVPGAAGRAFRRLAVGELVVMAAAVGTGVALSRTPPAEGPEPRLTTAEALLGYPMPRPLGATEWFTQWRVDTFFAPLALAAVVLYLVGVRRLARRGDRWPWGRTAAWIIGCAGLFWATSGAPGAYGEVLFSMHMVQHMTIATAVPTFLVLGAPVTLALRALRGRGDGSRGPREWLLVVVHSRLLRLLGHPLVAGGLFVAGLVAFYYSPLFELSLRTPTGHVLMTVHFLAVGYLFANVIVGVDPGPRRPIYPLRILLVMVAFGFHAFFSVSLMSSDTVLAEDWFAALGRTWGNTLERDQYVGASLGWALGDYPLAILAGAVIWGWVRDDTREAKRLDRQADRDNDQTLTDYNNYLRALSDHARTDNARTDNARTERRPH